VTEGTVPPAIRLVRDFVNTYEPQIDLETWSTADALKNWLFEEHLVPTDAQVTDTDLAVALKVREGLRNILLRHAGHEPDSAAVDALSDALASLPLRVDFGFDGYRLISTRNDDFGLALGQVLDAVRQSNEDRTWPRLKVCARDTCRWAFYDASRNQVRRWCSMAGCGNYIKMRRAYASRKSRAHNPEVANLPAELS
jgi:predicted RNA-binding Zn ribbon-like protein